MDPQTEHYCRNAHAIKTLEQDRDEIVRRLNEVIRDRSEDRVMAERMSGQITLLCARVPEDLPTILSDIRGAQKQQESFRLSAYRLIGAVVTALVLAFLAFALGGGLQIKT
jgi:hypothetical protein